MTAKSPTERARDFRKRLAGKGKATLNLIVERDVAELLRALAREHHQTQAQVLKLGVLTARRELAKMAERKVGGQ